MNLDLIRSSGIEKAKHNRDQSKLFKTYRLRKKTIEVYAMVENFDRGH